MKRLRGTAQTSEVIKVNAGGVVFVTFYETLTEAFPDSVIAKQLKEKENVTYDSEGTLFLDMSPIHFAILLDILRNPRLLNVVPKEMSKESFNALIDAQGLRPAERDVWPHKKQEIREAWLNQRQLDVKLDEQVLKLILGWIDLPALITGPEVSKTIYLPAGVYKLQDDVDLCLYIMDSMVELQALLDNVSDKTATLSIEPGHFSITKPASFTFQDVTYYINKSAFYELTITI